jgi:hypothetical protein
MNPMKSLVISGIDSVQFNNTKKLVYTIVRAFADHNNLAFIQNVTLLHGSQEAIVKIGQWKDTPQAEHFIRKLNNPSKVEVRLIYESDNWWIVRPEEVTDKNGNTWTIFGAMEEVKRIEKSIRQLKRNASFSENLMDDKVMVKKLIEKKNYLQHELNLIRDNTRPSFIRRR